MSKEITPELNKYKKIKTAVINSFEINYEKSQKDDKEKKKIIKYRKKTIGPFD